MQKAAQRPPFLLLAIKNIDLARLLSYRPATFLQFEGWTSEPAPAFFRTSRETDFDGPILAYARSRMPAAELL